MSTGSASHYFIAIWYEGVYSTMAYTVAQPSYNSWNLVITGITDIESWINYVTITNSEQ